MQSVVTIGAPIVANLTWDRFLASSVEVDTSLLERVHRAQVSSNQEDVLQFDNLSSKSSNLEIGPPIVLLFENYCHLKCCPPIRQLFLQMSSNLRRKMAGH